MKRTFSYFALAILSVVSIHTAAAAGSDWPKRQVKLVVGFPAGGSSDVIARAFGQALSGELNQTVLIENKAGASGVIATDAVIQAKDDHVLLFHTSGTFTIRPYVAKLRHDPWEALTVIARVASSPYVIVASPKLGVKSLQELAAFGQAHPDKLNMAVAGTGTMNDLVGNAFLRDAEVRAVSIPFSGSAPAMHSILAGDTDFLVTSIGNALPYIKDGKMIALAVTDNKRSFYLPDVPAATEAGFANVIGGNTYGLYGPARMSPETVEKIRAAIENGFKHEMVKNMLKEYAYSADPATPREYIADMRSEEQRLVPLIKTLELKLD